MTEKVSLLNTTSVSVSSITYAIRAQNALRAMGIRCEIGRDERYYTGQGCGYTPVSYTHLCVLFGMLCGNYPTKRARRGYLWMCAGFSTILTVVLLYNVIVVLV